MAESKFWFTPQQVAEKLGISKQTLYKYEKKKVFPEPGRNLINHWRQYSQEDIKKLKELIRGSVE